MTFMENAKRAFKLITADEIESKRQESRLAIRRQLALLGNDKRKRDVLLTQLAELDRRADLAADQHQEICQPAQARIKEIDAQVVELLSERKDVPAKLENERSKLFDKIQSANEALAKTVQTLKELRRPIARESAKLDDGGQIDVLTSKLAGIELGHPELFAAHFAAQNMLEWTLRRAAEIEGKLSKERQLAEDPRYADTAVNRQHVRNHEQLLKRLNEQAAELRTELEPLRQKMIAE